MRDKYASVSGTSPRFSASSRTRRTVDRVDAPTPAAYRANLPANRSSVEVPIISYAGPLVTNPAEFSLNSADRTSELTTNLVVGVAFHLQQCDRLQGRVAEARDQISKGINRGDVERRGWLIACEICQLHRIKFANALFGRTALLTILTPHAPADLALGDRNEQAPEIIAIGKLREATLLGSPVKAGEGVAQCRLRLQLGRHAGD